ncbi:MAG: diguanylate cyclase [Acidobacteriota bacterium]|nr:diguanylate cyclase [Acidobacteriota bacterium]
MDFGTTRKTNVAFGLVLAILLCLSAAFIQSTRALVASAGQVAHANEVLSRTETLISTVKDAETGQRGYLLTGESRYLNPYRSAAGHVREVEQDLREITRDNAGQQRRLGKLSLLIEAKLAELAETIQLYEANCQQEALAVVRTARGNDLMDRIRAVIGEMQADSKQFLLHRAGRERAGVRWTFLVLALGVGLALFLAGVALLMKARISESEKCYRLLAENCTDLIARLSSEGVYNYVSAASLPLLGYEPRELVGKMACDFVHPEDRDGMKRRGSRALSPVCCRLRHKDGSYIHIEIVSRPISGPGAGGETEYLEFGRDVSARHRAELLLKEREEEFRLLFEEAPVAYHEIDCNGIIQRVNRAECLLLGREAAEMVGKSVWDLVAPGERELSRSAVIEKLAGRRELGTISRNYVRANGTGLTIEIHENLIRNGDGEVVGIRSALLDITERRVTEALERGYREVLESIVQDKPLEEVLHGLTELLEREDPGVWYSVMLLRGEKLVRGAGSSLPEDYIAAVESVPVGPISGSCGAAAYWGKEVIVADVLTDPLWTELRDTASTHGVRACASIPILSGSGLVLGTLAATFSSVRQPGERERIRMDYAARLASVGIEHRQLTDRLAYQAGHDRLTGLANRHLFEDRLRQTLALSERHGTKFALMFIDLDGFKEINDRWGHSAGDQLLKGVAERLQAGVRRSDTVARIGGDEFTIILSDVGGRQGAASVGRKLLGCFEEPFPLDENPDGRLGVVSASIGISLFPDDGKDAAALQRSADAAMYQVKTEGKKKFQFFAT